MNLLEAITDQNIAIRCRSREDAEALLNACETRGLDVPTIGSWDNYQNQTCYRRSATEVHFCSIDYYIEHGYEIIDVDSLTVNSADHVNLSDYLY